MREQNHTLAVLPSQTLTSANRYDAPMTDHIQPTPRKRPIAFFALLALLAFTSDLSLYFYTKYQDATKPVQTEQQKILQTIGDVLALPAEQPTSFTISDKTKLTNQTLASRVENGDTLFVYTAARKLVVYRPSNKKVTDVLTIEASTPLPVKQ